MNLQKSFFILFICALQVSLSTIHSSTSFLLSDILLVMIFPYVFYCLYQERFVFFRGENWSNKSIYIGLVFLTVVPCYGLVLAKIYDGKIHHWGLINRFLGWFILLGYFFLGAWFKEKLSKKTHILFIKVFVLFLLLTFALFIFDVFAFKSDRLLSIMSGFSGFRGYSTSYSFLLTLGVLFLLSFNLKDGGLFHKYTDLIIVFLFIIMQIHTGSRAALFISASAMILIPLVFRKFKGGVKLILILISAYGAASVLSLIKNPHPYAGSFEHINSSIKSFTKINSKNINSISNEVNKKNINDYYDSKHPNKAFLPKQTDFIYHTVINRAVVNKEALSLWRKAPIFGVGLGAHLTSLKEKGVSETVIHSSYLQLLTETGIVGLLIYLGWFLYCLYTFVQFTRKERDKDSSFYLVLTLILISFGAISLLHDMLYSRVIWFLLGVGLYAPLKTSRKAVS